MKPTPLLCAVLAAATVVAVGCGGEPSRLSSATAARPGAEDGGLSAAMPTETDSAIPPRNGAVPCAPLNSGVPGDELCIRAADPGTGLYLHVGPTDYSDPDQMEEFSLLPGEERTEYYDLTSDNEGTVLFYEQHYRMRPGSHHVIVYMMPGQTVAEPGWTREQPDYRTSYSIGGSQRPKYDFPPDDVTPPEDASLVRAVGPKTAMAFELHYVATEEPVLREAWVNLMQSETPSPQVMGGLFLVGAGFSVPPHATQVLNYRATLSGADKRVVTLFGHRHASTERMSAWRSHGADRTLVYEDYDWQEPSELSYNTVVENPAPNADERQAGGTSGILTLVTGDVLEWECQVNNATDLALTFGNEVYTKEMCNLFGATVGGALQWFASPRPTVK